MPDQYGGGLSIAMPIATYTGTHQINGGTAIPANTTAAAQALTFTGVLTTDTNVAFAPRDAVVIPNGLILVSSVCTATDTITVQWRNNTNAAITPPASATWTAVVYKPFYLVD